MNRQALFDRHVRELADCVDGEWDEYQLLEAAAKIRSLLVDGGSSLIHEVNRQRRKRIVFEVVGETAYEREVMKDGPTFWSKHDGLSPQRSPVPGPVESLNLDRFLAHRVAISNDHTITVRDLVLHLANVEGGVHAGQPRGDLQEHLQALNAEFVIRDAGAVSSMMLGVADVVAHALAPLVTPPRSNETAT